ncbi:MAG: translation initiation factor IF-3 [Candidatus Falkowbacteria bacterium]|nr:translation initiation factor IF-3 [Candidatus Falkowbacteria bacterium]
MRIKFHRLEAKEKKFFKANRDIHTPQVFLIDENGDNFGIIDTAEALTRAQDLDMDLVEVNPKADPPVAKIMDMGQFRYEMEKKAHKQKVQQKKVETKNIRLSVRISDHDFEFRLNKTKKFLSKDNKLKLEISLKGREKQYPEKAAEIINDFVAKLQALPTLKIESEQPLTKQGGRFTILLINKK